MMNSQNKCAKCGSETANLVVCNNCNLPPGETKYYHYFSERCGECFFKVRGSGQDVLQIVTKTNVKGNCYKKGVYYIRYNSFISSKGWKLNDKLKENKCIKEISKATFDKVLEQVTNGFKDTPKPVFFNLIGNKKTEKSGQEIKRYAQPIVCSMIEQINKKADSIPDDISVMKERDLLDSVIDELKTIKQANGNN